MGYRADRIACPEEMPSLPSIPLAQMPASRSASWPRSRCPSPSLARTGKSVREKISTTATAVLGLVGLKDIDPVRSREHILLANILEYAWSRGQGLDLGELILQIQTPPFPKAGRVRCQYLLP